MWPSSVATVQILKITSPGSDNNSFTSKQAEDLLAVEEPLEIRIVYGDPGVDEVETVNVENFNSILRERVGRLVRKTKCFSKKKSRLRCALSVFQFYWDFISEIKRGITPAMMEKCSSHIWTWHEFYYSNALTNTN